MSGRTDNAELENYYRRRGYRKRIFYLEKYISILTSIISGDPIQISGLSRPTIDVDISSKGLEYDKLRLVLFPGDRVWKLYSVSGVRFFDTIAYGVIGDYTHFEEILKNISDQFFRVF